MIEIGLGHYLTLGAVIFSIGVIGIFLNRKNIICLLYTSDAADDMQCVDLGGRRIIKNKHEILIKSKLKKKTE